MKLERIVNFTPAFDKRTENPAKNCGIHCVELRMVLRGDKGAVQFVLYTGWFLHSISEGGILGDYRVNPPREFDKPMPADLGYHSLEPHYAGQEPIQLECEYLGGKPCYYDGSTLNAGRIFHVLVTEGSDGVWRELEKFYASTFEEAAA